MFTWKQKEAAVFDIVFRRIVIQCRWFRRADWCNQEHCCSICRITGLVFSRVIPVKYELPRMQVRTLHTSYWETTKEKHTAAWVVTVMLAWWDQTSSISEFKTVDCTQIQRWTVVKYSYSAVKVLFKCQFFIRVFFFRKLFFPTFLSILLYLLLHYVSY